MKSVKIDKFSLATIGDTIRRLPDLAAARLELAFAVGAAVEVSGTVQEIVKGDGRFKLVIQPEDVPSFVIFADCPGELKSKKKLAKASIRKGTRATVRGALVSFGGRAVTLSDCHLTDAGDRPKSKQNQALLTRE
jgi:hypothetical protein